MKTRKHRIKWDTLKIDWDKSNNSIAKSLGITGHTVKSARAKFGTPSKWKPNFKWSGVDWSQRDRTIAEARGVSLVSVWSARARYGTPRPKITRLSTPAAKMAVRLLKAAMGERPLGPLLQKLDFTDTANLKTAFTIVASELGCELKAKPFSLGASKPLPDHIIKIRLEALT